MGVIVTFVAALKNEIGTSLKSDIFSSFPNDGRPRQPIFEHEMKQKKQNSDQHKSEWKQVVRKRWETVEAY